MALRTKIAVALALGMIGLGLSQVGVPVDSSEAATAPSEPLDCTDSLVEETLANGAAWRMCARIHPMKGLVLEQVEYKPPTSREYTGYKRVLDHLSLGQLNVPYDNGEIQYNDITAYGFGNQNLVPQDGVTCIGQARAVQQTYTFDGRLVTRTIPGICAAEVGAGLATHSYEQATNGDALRLAERSTALEISSLSKVGWYEYQQSVKLDDQGQLDVGLGATGDVAPGGPGGTFFGSDSAHGWPLGGAEGPLGGPTFAGSHWHNAVWKVDFGVDGGTRQHVEQWDYANTAEPPLQPRIAGIGTRKERAFHATPRDGLDEQTWFRVLNPDSLNPDGHPRSYEIVNPNDPYDEVPVYAPLVTFTNANECQEYASDNLNAACPGQSILDYVAGDTEALDDPVAWVNVGFHHIDRDEDQSPMQMHWQRFQLVPRDFFAQKPTVPDARSCINGAGWIDSFDSPCVATNIVLPQISGDLAALEVGKTLRASTGEWNESRTTWEYAYLWYRNGKPIMVTPDNAATAPQYTLTESDLGTTITVRVTASQVGFPSGTAESAPVAVPGRPTPPRPTPIASSVKVSAKKAKVGKRPVARVTVSATGRVPTGRVTISYRNKVVGSATLSGGKATVKLKAFKKKGRYSLRATYAGSATVKASSKAFRVRIVRR